MAHELKQLRLEALSDVGYSFWAGKHPGKSYERDVLVIRFEGVYRFGSGGNPDATFMLAMGNAGVQAFEPEAIITDLSALSYEWGDMMDSVFGIGGDLKATTAIVVGKQCREAIGTLCFGVDSTKDACEQEWIFDSLDAAWNYVTKLLDEGEQPPIHEAASSGDIQRVKQLLASGEDPNRLDSGEQTPLHSASDAAVVKLLLDAGANPKAQCTHGTTPLHLVKNAECARLLLDAGADPDARSGTGFSPLCHAQSVELVSLLIEAGADVHLRSRSSLLHFVRRPEIAKVLIEAGADVNMIDGNGQSPLDRSEESHQIFNRQAKELGFTDHAEVARNYAEISSLLRANGGLPGAAIRRPEES